MARGLRGPALLACALSVCTLVPCAVPALPAAPHTAAGGGGGGGWAEYQDVLPPDLLPALRSEVRTNNSPFMLSWWPSVGGSPDIAASTAAAAAAGVVVTAALLSASSARRICPSRSRAALTCPLSSRCRAMAPRRFSAPGWISNGCKTIGCPQTSYPCPPRTPPAAATHRLALPLRLPFICSG